MRHDLALLRVEDAPNSIEPIAVSDSQPPSGERLKVLGFPLGVSVVSSNELKIRETGGTNLREIIDQRTRDEPEDSGFGILLDCPILDLEGTLLPGHSGAPILNSANQLVGIGDGGLEQGAAARSWAIPASALEELMSKPDSLSPPSGWPSRHVVKNFFGAELDATYAGEDRREITLNNSSATQTTGTGEPRLVRARTRSFDDLRRTCDDQLGLNQLIMQLIQSNQTPGAEIIDPDEFEYDIYQEIRSGASFAVPAGSQISQRGNLLTVDADGGALLLRFQMQRAVSQEQAMMLTNTFSSHATSDLPFQNWQPDTNFSQPMPVMSPLGFMFRRTSWVGFEPSRFGFQPASYAFMLTAFKGNTALGAIAINQAMQSGQFNRRLWAQMHLGIQLTGFSHSPGQ